MRLTRASSRAAFLLFTTIVTPPCWAQTPAPMASQQFALPLSDQTTATAVLLPSPEGRLTLVYATSTGKIGLWTLTPSPTPPSPTPVDPPPSPTPVDPPPTAPVAVITITETTPAALPRAVAARLTATAGTYHAFTIAMVATKEPPANSLTWIGRTAGKSYPYTFLASRDHGKTLWQGPTPKTDADFIAVINTALHPPAARRSCVGPNSPYTETRKCQPSTSAN